MYQRILQSLVWKVLLSEFYISFIKVTTILTLINQGIQLKNIGTVQL